MKTRFAFLVLAAMCIPALAVRAEEQKPWQKIVAERLPSMGHRNWIVIADSAYPAQSSDGIETIVTDASQLDVVREVLSALSQTKHVRPNIFTDAELKFVPEQDAPGVTEYRNALTQILSGHEMNVIPHEQIISKLDEAGKTFKVLILKTNMTIPYTSVFMRLECAYWNPEAEKRLRDAIGGSVAK